MSTDPDRPSLSFGESDTPVAAGPTPAGAITDPHPGVAVAPADAPRIPGLAIRRLLGRGGMGRVYLAWHLALKREVAVKMISTERANEIDLMRFEREAQAIARIDNPNVLRVFDYGFVEGRPYQVLEYASGGSLADSLAPGTAFPPAEAAALVERVARGVAAAHRLDIVHRDLKPGNVLLAGDGTPKVADFGLASSPQNGLALTAPGQPLGTPLYMSPEQFADARAVGPAADVWALGAILYRLLTGDPPFRGATAELVAQAVRDEEPTPPRAVRPSIPPDLEGIVLRCLRKNAAERPPDATALADALAAWRPARPAPIRAASLIAAVLVAGVALWLALSAAAPERPAADAGPTPVAATPPPEPAPDRPVPVDKTIPKTDDPPALVSRTTGMAFVRIPAGSFRMGATDGEASELPPHEVAITRPFLLGKYEVTRGQFRQFVQDTGFEVGATSYRLTWEHPDFGQTDDHPVVCVCWTEARAFCAWLTRKDGREVRLPSEAEWEYACRAGTTTAYSCGDDPEGLALVGNLSDGTSGAVTEYRYRIRAKDGYIYTAAVGKFRANPFGLHDMHGNVYEWCEDFTHDYPPDRRVNPVVKTKQMHDRHVARGGSWFYGSGACRSAGRMWGTPDARRNDLGFRVACTIPAPAEGPNRPSQPEGAPDVPPG